MFRNIFNRGRSDDLNGSVGYVCHKCDKMFSSRYDLNKHLTGACKHQYFCSKCGMEHNFTKSQMEEHKVECKRNNKHQYFCSKCGIEHEFTKSQMEEHKVECKQNNNQQSNESNNNNDYYSGLFDSFFGSSDNNNNSFGSSNNNNNIFGSSNNNNSFGSSNNNNSFGSSNTNNLFGSSNTNNLFGSSNNNDDYGGLFENLFGSPLRSPPPASYKKPSAPPASSAIILPSGKDTEATEDTPDIDLCKICTGNIMNTINLPCAHAFFCIKCSNDYVTKYNNTTCPTCSDELVEIKQYYK